MAKNYDYIAELSDRGKNDRIEELISQASDNHSSGDYERKNQNNFEIGKIYESLGDKNKAFEYYQYAFNGCAKDENDEDFIQQIIAAANNLGLEEKLSCPSENLSKWRR